MHAVQNTPSYRGQQVLATLAGWTPGLAPVHRALEAEAAEAIDTAARVTFQRRVAQ